MQSVVALIGWPEIIGVLIILVVMFGATHIPQLLKGMSHGLDEFRKATRQVDSEVARMWETESEEDDGEDRPRYGFKFWLIVALGVAVVYGVAVVLRELLQ